VPKALTQSVVLDMPKPLERLAVQFAPIRLEFKFLDPIANNSVLAYYLGIE
jgi:hypothetical protein